jgi:hypothetical protein
VLDVGDLSTFYKTLEYFFEQEKGQAQRTKKNASIFIDEVGNYIKDPKERNYHNIALRLYT